MDEINRSDVTSFAKSRKDQFQTGESVGMQFEKADGLELAGLLEKRLELGNLKELIYASDSFILRGLAPRDFSVYVDSSAKAYLKWRAPVNTNVSEIGNLKFEIAYRPEGGSIQSWIVPEKVRMSISPPSTPEDQAYENLPNLVYYSTELRFVKEQMRTFYVRLASGGRFENRSASFTLGFPSALRNLVWDFGSAYTSNNIEYWSIIARWDPPIDDGSSEIRYEALIKKYYWSAEDLSPNAQWTSINALKHTFTLEWGWIYLIHIRAANAIGAGEEAILDVALVIN